MACRIVPFPVLIQKEFPPQCGIALSVCYGSGLDEMVFMQVATGVNGHQPKGTCKPKLSKPRSPTVGAAQYLPNLSISRPPSKNRISPAWTDPTQQATANTVSRTGWSSRTRARKYLRSLAQSASVFVGIPGDRENWKKGTMEKHSGGLTPEQVEQVRQLETSVVR